MMSKWRVLNDSDCKVAIVLQLRKDKTVMVALENIKLACGMFLCLLLFPMAFRGLLQIPSLFENSLSLQNLFYFPSKLSSFCDMNRSKNFLTSNDNNL